jgi:hypothetical protein
LRAARICIRRRRPSASRVDDGGAAQFKAYAIEYIGKTIIGAKAPQAGDVTTAQAAWIEPRKGWEAMEPVTGQYFGDIDKLVDAQPQPFPARRPCAFLIAIRCPRISTAALTSKACCRAGSTMC